MMMKNVVDDEDDGDGSGSPYILKADVLDVRTPQKIQIFRRKIVWERENYHSQSLKANNSAMCYK